MMTAQQHASRRKAASLMRVLLALRRQVSITRDAQSGQMTVELALALPVMLVVALIVVNAMSFFSQCASFDRIAHETIRAYATAPAAGQSSSTTLASIEAAIKSQFDQENVDISVSQSPTGFDLVKYQAKLEVQPTVFGINMSSEIFGVRLVRLKHTTEYVIDTYKPGIVA